MNRRDFSLNLLAAAIPMGWQAPAGLRINRERVNRHLAELSQFGRNAQGGVSRVAYSEADLAGREYTIRLMRGAGLEASIDAAGNLVGRRAGRDSSLPPLVIGSHIDSVPEGGNYDGEVGSMGAIEVAQTLAENRVALRHPLEVIIFQNEEGGTIGSHAIAYGLTEKTLGLKTNSGKTIRDGISYIGGDPSRLSDAVRKPGSIAAYIELHIEQGGILHAEKTDIGVVEGIVGINWWDVTIEGFANHAGTTPMNQRRDAMLAAARYIDAVNRVATSIEGRQVATVGRLQPFPGAYNVIPGKVVTSLEIRDLDQAKMDLVYQKILPEVSKIEQATGTKFTFNQTMRTPPAPTDPRIRRVIDESAKGLGYSTRSMPSGAGHDAQEMAHLGPVGMIFVPSVDGISHSPREFSSPEAIAKGVNVLLQAVLKLD